MIDSLKDLTYAPYFETYLETVRFEDVSLELEDSGKELEKFFFSLPPKSWNYRYAADKWTVKEVLYHIAQTELIFNFRALTIACETNKVEIPGFDENEYVASTNLVDRVPQWLVAFFKTTRQQSILMSKMLSTDQLSKVGTASGHEAQVKALFYISSGHTRHHLGVLKDRYSN